MPGCFQSTRGRCLTAFAVWLVLIPWAVLTATFAVLNLASALAVAGFGYLVTFVEGPDYQGPIPTDLCGMPPAFFVALQGFALLSALLLGPCLIGVAIATASRRLLTATALIAVILQAACMIIFAASSEAALRGWERCPNPGGWGLITLVLYFALACWGCVGDFFATQSPARPSPLSASPRADASE